jgi:hypothetical protein
MGRVGVPPAGPGVPAWTSARGMTSVCERRHPTRGRFRETRSPAGKMPTLPTDHAFAWRPFFAGMMPSRC